MAVEKRHRLGERRTVHQLDHRAAAGQVQYRRGKPGYAVADHRHSGEFRRVPGVSTMFDKLFHATIMLT